MAGRLTSKLAIVVFLILAARLLSKEEYGIYSYVLVLAGTFAILADPQVSAVAGRDVSSGRTPVSRAYWSALPVVLVSGAVAGTGLLCFGLLDIGPGTTPGLLLIAAGYVVFNRLMGLGLDMLRALGRFGLEAAMETIGTLALVAAAIAVAAAGLGVEALMGVFLLQALLMAIVCHLVLRGEAGPPARPGREWRRLLRTGIRLSVAASATAVAARAPLIIVGGATSAVTVASYSAALRFPEAAYLLSLTMGQALLPSIASMLTTDPPRAAKFVRRAIALAVLVGAAAAAVAAALGSELTSAVFGAQYSDSGELMSVMMLGAPFSGVFWLSWFALFAYGRERDVLWVALLGALAAVGAGLLVIPGEGAMGAAWVYVAVLALMAACTFVMFERQARARRTAAPGPVSALAHPVGTGGTLD